PEHSDDSRPDSASLPDRCRASAPPVVPGPGRRIPPLVPPVSRRASPVHARPTAPRRQPSAAPATTATASEDRTPAPPAQPRRGRPARDCCPASARGAATTPPEQGVVAGAADTRREDSMSLPVWSFLLAPDPSARTRKEHGLAT